MRPPPNSLFWPCPPPPPKILPLQTPHPPTQPEALSGLIERVTFFNEENGWAVLKVKAKGQRDHVTVLGSLPSVNHTPSRFYRVRVAN